MSLVVESRVDRLAPYNTMYGAGSQYGAHDSQSTPYAQRSGSGRSPHEDASSYAPRSHPQAPSDTPMSDYTSRNSSVSAFSTRSQTVHSDAASVRSSNSIPAPQPGSNLHGSSRPPPSPRFRGGHGPSAQQTPSSAPASQQLPHPPSAASTGSSSHTSPALSTPSQPQDPASPNRIKVQSLAHIQSFTQDEDSPLSRSASRRARRDGTDSAPQYEISEMPVADVIEMVAGLLTKITTTNDRQHEHLHRQIPPPEGTTGLSQQTNSVLAFHGKNVPQISILSYLSRIHKYCPTTYEVFLSLLVYFDRMTETVNSRPMEHLRRQSHQEPEQVRARAGSETTLVEDTTMQGTQDLTPTPPDSGSLGGPTEPSKASGQGEPPSPPDVPMDENFNLSHIFVVDSYNIHRLVIAGVTCASKFFSDVFYTNSRYAKVGGLPLPELNHLELQFLLLNDFRLSIPLEEIQAYGTMLVEFYAREVVAQQESLR